MVNDMSFLLIMIKGGEYLERNQKIDTIVFNKVWETIPLTFSFFQPAVVSFLILA